MPDEYTQEWQESCSVSLRGHAQLFLKGGRATSVLGVFKHSTGQSPEQCSLTLEVALLWHRELPNPLPIWVVPWYVASHGHWLSTVTGSTGCMGCHSHCYHAFLCLFRCEIPTHKVPWYIILFHLYCLILSVIYSFLCNLCTVSTVLLKFCLPPTF